MKDVTQLRNRMQHNVQAFLYQSILFRAKENIEKKIISHQMFGQLFHQYQRTRHWECEPPKQNSKVKRRYHEAN